MFLFVAVILGIFGVILIAAGFWLLLVAKQVKITSNLIHYLVVGPLLAALVRSASEPQEYYLKGWAKNLLGLIFILAGIGVFYAIWSLARVGLIFV